MNNLAKTAWIILIGLILTLLIKPYYISSLSASLVGRLILIMAILICSKHSITLGILAAFLIFSTTHNMNPFFIEGLDVMKPQPKTTPDQGDDMINTPGTIGAIPSGPGIDKEDIKKAIASKDSKTLPVSDAKSSDDISAHNPALLSNTSSLTEGFCPCAASV